MVEWVTLTGRLTRGGGGGPATGYVQVRVLDSLQDPDAQQVLVTQPTLIRLDTSGGFTTQVPVTEDPAEPLWIVVDLLPDGAAPDQLVFTVDGPVDLADVLAVPVVPDSDAHEVAIPWAVIGKPGGVAPLNSSGKVPAQYLPAASGGGGDSPWRKHTQTVPQATFPVTHGFGREPAAVTLHSLDLSRRYQGFEVAHLDVNTIRISMDKPTACVVLIS